MSDVAVGAPTARIVPWWLVLIQGIAVLGIGLFLVFTPIKSAVALIYLLAWWWLIAGIFELGSLFVDRTAWGWRLFSGIISILAGGYIIASPLIGAAYGVAIATILLGINGIIFGVVDLVKAFQGAGWGKGALGVLSLVIGAAIAFNFTSFMMALPWVWGVFAVAGGIAAIALAFQMRKAQA
jgi:uncharacterized membrane protein HdeD (DUF308 family)